MVIIIYYHHYTANVIPNCRFLHRCEAMFCFFFVCRGVGRAQCSAGGERGGAITLNCATPEEETVGSSRSDCFVSRRSSNLDQ